MAAGLLRATVQLDSRRRKKSNNKSGLGGGQQSQNRARSFQSTYAFSLSLSPATGRWPLTLHTTTTNHHRALLPLRRTRAVARPRNVPYRPYIYIQPEPEPGLPSFLPRRGRRVQCRLLPPTPRIPGRPSPSPIAAAPLILQGTGLATVLPAPRPRGSRISDPPSVAQKHRRPAPAPAPHKQIDAAPSSSSLIA